MKLVSFQRNDRSSFGRVEGDEVVDLAGAPGGEASLKQALAAPGFDWSADGERVPLADVTLLPVVPDPAKILCVGHNYESHRQETGRAKVSHPSIFTRFADTLVPADQPIRRPAASKDLDYEGELAIVIGKPGRDIPVERALEHVAGYACFNDASVRDWQWHTSQFTPGKNFPKTGGFGPWLVTPDEAGDLAGVHVVTRLNGEVMQDQPVSDMIFSIAEIIAYISTFTALSGGDVIATGTPGGVGAKRTPPVWMKDGDLVEVEIGPIGTLRNGVVADVVRSADEMN